MIGQLGWLVATLLAALGLVAAVAVAWPLVGADRPVDPLEGAARTEQIRAHEDLDRSLTSLREIAFDHACGNLSDGDFERLDAAERVAAVRLMRQIDAVEPSGEST